MITFTNQTKQARTFLATTALEEFWDKTQPILFLGDWCTTYENKEAWENVDGDIIYSPLLDHDPDQTLAYIESIYQALLPTIADWLNKIHQTHFSLSYWEVLIGSFLFIHIQTIYERFERLKKVFQQYPSLETIGLAKTSFLVPFNIEEYYTFAMQSDLWNLQINTELIQAYFHKPKHYLDYQSVAEVRKRQELLKNSGNQYRFLTKIKLYLLWSIIKLRGNHTVALAQHDFNKNNLLKLIRLAKLRILPIAPRQLSAKLIKQLHTTPDLTLRTEIANLASTSQFSQVVLALLATQLPMSFLENFDLQRKISKKQFPYFSKMVVGSPVASGEAMKIWQAEHYQKGMRRIGLQHGGGYCALKSISDEYLEHKTADFYITWGKAGTNHKVIGLPSVPLCEHLESHANAKQSLPRQSIILWVATEFTRYPMPEIKLALGAGHYEAIYYAWQETVMRLLNTDIFSDLTMRLRFSDFSDRWKFLRDQFPTLNLCKPANKFSFYTQISEAKLLLFDNLNTTHLYGLARNIPSILFWDERIWTLRDEVKMYFHALQEAGIFHTSPASAGKKINEVAKNPWPWWQSQVVQQARKQYCDYFCGVTENWLNQWYKQLLKLLAR